MNIGELKDTVEVLFHLRCLQRPRTGRKLHTEMAIMLVGDLLHDNGLDPGETEDDAERLKQNLIERSPHKSGFFSAPTHVEAVLEETARLTGSMSPFRELSRFNVFCSKMKKHGGGQDGVGKLIYDWCRAGGRYPATTIEGAIKLYFQWISEAYSQSEETDALDGFELIS